MFNIVRKRQSRPTAEDRRKAKEEVFRRRFEDRVFSPRYWL